MFSIKYSSIKTPRGPPQRPRDQNRFLTMVIPCPEGLFTAWLCLPPTSTVSPIRMTDLGFSKPPCSPVPKHSPHCSHRGGLFLMGLLYSFPNMPHLRPEPMAALALLTVLRPSLGSAPFSATMDGVCPLVSGRSEGSALPSPPAPPRETVQTEGRDAEEQYSSV